MKKEKETLDQQLRSMGINPPPGPAYIPTPAEMRPGPSLSFIGQDNMLSIRDRSLTTESFAGDLSEGMSVSTKDGPKAKSSIRIRSSSESEVPENKANPQQSSRVSLVRCSLVQYDYNHSLSNTIKTVFELTNKPRIKGLPET